MAPAQHSQLTSSAAGARDDEFVEKICALVSRTLDLPPDVLPLSTETRLFGSGLGVDSIDVLRLVTAIEGELDITIDDGELTRSTFEDIISIVDLVRRKRSANP